MAGRFGVRRTKTQDHAVQHPLALHAFVVGETFLQKQPSWWNCTTGSFLGVFRWHLGVSGFLALEKRHSGAW